MKFFYITAVYARCSFIERLDLWEDLQNILEEIYVSSLVGGDFNVILDDSEKLGGLIVTQQEIEIFAGYVSSCALNGLNFTRSSYTW